MSDTNSTIATLYQQVTDLINLKNELDDKIDAKLDIVDYDESKLGKNKAAVTRWRNRISETKQDIEKFRNEIEKLQTMKKEELEFAVPVQSGGGTPSISKELKRLQHDFTTQPRFTQQ